jgi:4-hydroxythreonine-4-phosphate dehydrogenase
MLKSSCLKPLVVTTGEPAGIGPDIALALQDRIEAPLVLLGDYNLLCERAGLLGFKKPPLWQEGERFGVIDVPLLAPCQAGVPNTKNALYVLSLLDEAIKGTMAGKFRAMVTAPLSKAVIAQAGIPFSGHTEYLGDKTHSFPVMFFVAEHLKIALLTTHLPLAQVSATISQARLWQNLDVLVPALRQAFGIARPHIAVLGLNPHAGESGHLGDEEETIIRPALLAYQNQNALLDGPLPADSVFIPGIIEQYDAVLAMYHDQALPVFKMLAFDRGVNVTLGLPFVRTSPDHGTAFALAGTGKAKAHSMVAAANLALQLS